MAALVAVIVVVALLALILLALSLRIVKQYEEGVLFRLGASSACEASGPDRSSCR